MEGGGGGKPNRVGGDSFWVPCAAGGPKDLLRNAEETQGLYSSLDSLLLSLSVPCEVGCRVVQLFLAEAEAEAEVEVGEPPVVEQLPRRVPVPDTDASVARLSLSPCLACCAVLCCAALRCAVCTGYRQRNKIPDWVPASRSFPAPP